MDTLFTEAPIIVVGQSKKNRVLVADLEQRAAEIDEKHMATSHIEQL